jgi:predicted secreted protein
MLKDACYRCMTAALVASTVLATVLSSGCSAFAPPHSSGGILVIEVPADSGPDAVEADRSTREGEMKVGDRLEVRLGAYAGTGFAWSLAGPVPGNMQMTTADPAGKVGPVAGTTTRPGGATMSTFGMTAVAQGDAKMRFVLMRPWETDGKRQVARTVEVEVVVKTAPNSDVQATDPFK